MGKYLLTCLWFFAGNVIALDSGDPPNTDILNQIENYHSSTCQLIFSESYTCSGVLINNTSDQGRPLILTAAHCLESEADLNSMVVVFGKRKLLKDQVYKGLEWRSTGAFLLSSSKELDFALLELKSKIPDRVSPIYLGWNKTISRPEMVSTIHSPDFEDTEYSYSLEKPAMATFDGLYKAVDSGFWRVDQWAGGTTSPGSSGAPLLNSNFDIIGGLSGSTDWPGYKSDYFFRFDLAYEYFDDVNSQLKAWIDPDGLGSTRHYQPTQKIRNYNYTSHVSKSERLMNGASVFEKFSVSEDSKINGLYISIGEINEASGSTISIVLNQDESEFYAEEINADDLSPYSENFFPLQTPPLINGVFTISLKYNSDNSSAHITIPRLGMSNLTSYFIAFNSSKP